MLQLDDRYLEIGMAAAKGVSIVLGSSIFFNKLCPQWGQKRASSGREHVDPQARQLLFSTIVIVIVYATKLIFFLWKEISSCRCCGETFL